MRSPNWPPVDSPNKQIGIELFLPPRTVSTYLYGAYPKLGISTRAALRDALTGRRLDNFTRTDAPHHRRK
jgi:hypothetical protein